MQRRPAATTPAGSSGPIFLVDLDGVLREWPEAADHAGPVVPRSAVHSALFEPTLLHRAVTGEITDEAWRSLAAEALLESYGVDYTERLLAEAEFPGEVRPEVLAIVRRVRERIRVGLLTNATTRLARHLRALNLTEEFDWIFNSSEMGVAKPDIRIFREACSEMGCTPREVVYVDDKVEHAEAAATIGIRAHVFTAPQDLLHALVAEGFLAREN